MQLKNPDDLTTAGIAHVEEKKPVIDKQADCESRGDSPVGF